MTNLKLHGSGKIPTNPQAVKKYMYLFVSSMTIDQPSQANDLKVYKIIKNEFGFLNFINVLLPPLNFYF